MPGTWNEQGSRANRGLGSCWVKPCRDCRKPETLTYFVRSGDGDVEQLHSYVDAAEAE